MPGWIAAIEQAAPYVISAVGGLLSTKDGGSQGGKVDLGPGEGTFKRDVIPQLINLLHRSPDSLVAALGPGLTQALAGIQGFGQQGQGAGALNAARIGGVADTAAGSFADILNKWGAGQAAQAGPAAQAVGGQAPSAAQATAAQAGPAAQFRGAQATGGQVGNLNFDYAGQIADNPYTQATIDAALRDPYRQLTEDQLPALGMVSAATGNTGSSRRGVAEGVLQRGYADRAADVGAQVRNANYLQGVDIAGTQASTNASLLQALGLSNAEFANQTGLANAQMFNQTNLANAGFANQVGTENAQMANQVGAVNAGLTNQRDLTNAQMMNAMGLGNAQQVNQYNLGGLNAGLGLGELGQTASTAGNAISLQSLLASLNAGDYLKNYQQSIIDAPLNNLLDINKALLPTTNPQGQRGRPDIAQGLGTFNSLMSIFGGMNTGTAGTGGYPGGGGGTGTGNFLGFGNGNGGF